MSTRGRKGDRPRSRVSSRGKRPRGKAKPAATDRSEGDAVEGSLRAERRPQRNRPGAPRVQLDLEDLEKLARLGHKDPTIATLLRISLRTLKTCIAEDDQVAMALEYGRAMFEKDIRVVQKRRALQGSDRMLIHLGETELGQRKSRGFEVSGPGGGPLMIGTEELDSEVERKIREFQQSRGTGED